MYGGGLESYPVIISPIQAGHIVGSVRNYHSNCFPPLHPFLVPDLVKPWLWSLSVGTRTGLQEGEDAEGVFQVLPLVGKCPWTVRKSPISANLTAYYIHSC